MWKLLHKIFGYDYVHWKNTADRGIARVRTDGEGNPYYIRYKGIGILDRLDNSDYSKANIIWLTCSPTKYLKAVKTFNS